MHELLLRNIKQKIDLTIQEKERLKTFFIPKKLRKKQYLLQEGEVCQYAAFVEKGMLRSYSVDKKGNEHILQFATENWWISDLYSFFSGEPSVYMIDALEDSELLLIRKDKYEEMLQTIPSMERYFRLLLQNNLIAIQRRLNDKLSLSAEDLYLNMIQTCDSIPQRVPQHMIASFLGITRETLSRIRKQLAGGK
ncbi:MAG: cyclic nucleotide-binding protein [Citrobacter freundii]|nr:MAG: cyclic nucleotide-binding protein [Citrobacter freundii]